MASAGAQKKTPANTTKARDVQTGERCVFAWRRSHLEKHSEAASALWIRCFGREMDCCAAESQTRGLQVVTWPHKHAGARATPTFRLQMRPATAGATTAAATDNFKRYMKWHRLKKKQKEKRGRGDGDYNLKHSTE